MPFTPIHMGPGIAIKALLQGSFSLMVFGWSQILMDIQPLIGLLTNQARLHGFSHTYIGALLIAGLAIVTGKGLSEWGLRWLEIGKHNSLVITWKIAAFSALIGTFSHVLIDSLMHRDMTPWSPLSDNNSLLGWVSIDQLHSFCWWLGGIGALIYLAVRIWVSRTRENGIDWR